MFDVGFTEILLIGIVALVVIGPERLPAVAKTAGHYIGKLQRFVRGVKTDLASELESGDLKKLIGDQREQIDELREMVSTAKKDFQSTTQSVVKSTREGLQELETSVNEAKEETARVGEQHTSIASDSKVSESETSEGTSSVSIRKRGHGQASSVSADSDGANASNDKPMTNDQSPADQPTLKRTGTTDADSQ